MSKLYRFISFKGRADWMVSKIARTFQYAFAIFSPNYKNEIFYV